MIILYTVWKDNNIQNNWSSWLLHYWGTGNFNESNVLWFFSDDLRSKILDFRRMKGRVENDIFCTGHIKQCIFDWLLGFDIRAFFLQTGCMIGF